MSSSGVVAIVKRGGVANTKAQKICIFKVVGHVYVVSLRVNILSANLNAFLACCKFVLHDICQLTGGLAICAV